MSFDVAAEAYDAFMGRYSRPLAPQLADLAGVTSGQRVLDVGCGTGALTRELVARTGEANVAAVDPSAPFVAAMGARFPGIELHRAAADALPFPDGAFDATLAQLVVHFLPDPVAGIREMARVTCAGGVVAAGVWDHFGQGGPLSTFWGAARTLDPGVDDESGLPGVREGHLVELLSTAGLADVRQATLAVTREHQTFDEWWEPYTGGVGPAGAYLATLDTTRREALREACRAQLGDGPITIHARCWAARGTVPSPLSPAAGGEVGP